MHQDSHSPSTTPVFQEKQSQLPKRISVGRFWLPLLLQTGLILAIPAQAVYTQVTGKTAVLQTIPVDPYDPLRGYSQTLSYEFSRVDRLRSLPGWEELVKQQAGEKSTTGDLAAGTRLYVILEAPTAAKSQTPSAWKPVRVSSDRPTTLPANQIALKGKSIGSSIIYGLETYYLPEEKQQVINQEIAQAQRGSQQQSLLVEVKVDPQGRAVPISFWVSDRNYRF